MPEIYVVTAAAEAGYECLIILGFCIRIHGKHGTGEYQER
jgi:hypothetical protein